MQAQVAGFKLSPQQSRIWLAQGERQALTQATWRIATKLDEPKLRQAFEQAVARHEVLRTTYPSQVGMKVPFQVVQPTLTLEWQSGTWTDGVGLDQAGAQDAARAFDMVSGPVLRVKLLLSEKETAIVVTAPAVALDAESAGLLIGEVARLYAGQPLEETLQYADYSEWSNGLAESEDAEAVLAKQFWTELGKSSLRYPALPLEYRQQRIGAPSGQVGIDLNQGTHSALAAVASEAGADVEALLFAAWSAYLRRLNPQSQVVVSRVFNGRTVEEAKTSLGAFARPLPVVLELELDATMVDVLAATRAASREINAVQDYGFGFALPGASVSFEYILTDDVTFGVANGRLTAIAHAVQASKAKLVAIHSADTLTLALQFDAGHISAEAATTLAGNFGRFLGSLAKNPTAPIGKLAILSDAQRTQLTDGFNRSVIDFGAAAFVQQRFEAQAQKSPSAPALADAHARYSYSELNARANQLAHHLRKFGVGPNVPVAIMLPRSAEAIVAILGVLKAGGAYTPLVPDTPKARLAHQLTETNAPVVITTEALRSSLPAEVKIHVLCLDRDAEVLKAERATDLKSLNSADDLAYVIYTSGSTGTPKGVGVRHRNLMNYTESINRKLSAAAETAAAMSFAVVSTIAADLGNTCVFPALTSGGCLHVIDYETAMSATRFGEYCAKNPIDVLKITPSHLNALLSLPGGERVIPRKYLFLGGDAASWELIRRVRAAAACKIVNHYGPTETTVGSLTYALGEKEDTHEFAAKVPIGSPLGNTRVYLLDQYGELVPVGVPGDLHIAGAGVASGYLKQEAQTKERFVSEYGATDTTQKMYRTGDLARWLPDGTIEFIGRVDHQVKIRGFRVEPGEIEATLAQIAGVRQAVVIAVDDATGDKRLVAYIVAAQNPPSVEALRSAAALRLPDYMVPSAFVFLKEFPLTANGKVDRTALPDPDQAHSAQSSNYIVPRTPVEEKIAEIWAQVLKMEKVSVEDNFFAIGGHSLLATQVISRIQSGFNVQIPLRAIFESSTVAGLAARVTELQTPHANDAELASMLGELESLSDEEAERLLALEADGQDAK